MDTLQPISSAAFGQAEAGGGSEPLVALFEGLPHVLFSLKGGDGRYLASNQSFADRAGARSPSGVVGKRAADLFSPELAVSYEAQDAVLLAGGPPLRRMLEVIGRPDGSHGWYVTNKALVPLGAAGGGGRAAGEEAGRGGGPRAGRAGRAIAAVSVDEHAPVDDEAMAGLAAVVRHVRERVGGSPSLAELAAVGQMPAATLERRMRRVLELSPRQLVARTRLEDAVHRIATTAAPLGEIALACGFFDQAAMNRQMRQALGVTPGSLRARRER